MCFKLKLISRFLPRSKQLSYAIVVDTTYKPIPLLCLFNWLGLREILTDNRSESVTEGWLLWELNFFNRFFEFVPVIWWLLADLALLEKLRLVFVLPWLWITQRILLFIVWQVDLLFHCLRPLEFNVSRLLVNAGKLFFLKLLRHNL